MNDSPLFITRDDHARLRLLLHATPPSAANPAVAQLREELDRATILESAALPPDVVTMGARVQFEDLATGEREEYTLTFPEQADASAGRLSILAPIGTALLGFRAGDTVDWPTPGGLRRLKIQQVVPRTASEVVPE